jgi:hypothetical protein
MLKQFAGDIAVLFRYIGLVRHEGWDRLGRLPSDCWEDVNLHVPGTTSSLLQSMIPKGIATVCGGGVVLQKDLLEFDSGGGSGEHIWFENRTTWMSQAVQISYSARDLHGSWLPVFPGLEAAMQLISVYYGGVNP